MSMIRHTLFARHTLAAIATGLTLALAAPAFAQDAMSSADDTYKEIESAMGGVPTFVQQIAKSAVPGFWSLVRDLEISQTTALDPKTKALISLAVASQIPCQYCVWADTNTLKQMGATDQEIAEAVAMAGLTRFTSAQLYGLQVDMEQFRKELGGE
jgi:AhpD family alkylhydroperoxidase